MLKPNKNQNYGALSNLFNNSSSDNKVLIKLFSLNATFLFVLVVGFSIFIEGKNSVDLTTFDRYLIGFLVFSVISFFALFILLSAREMKLQNKKSNIFLGFITLIKKVFLYVLLPSAALATVMVVFMYYFAS
jgi:hypothetical protein